MTIRKSSIHRPSIIEIREIFPSATGVGIILPEIGKGLHIHFNGVANFFDELKISKESLTFYSRKLPSLLKAFGIINLMNCFIPEFSNKGGLSSGRDNLGRTLQDPFHRDWLETRPDFLTVIHRQMLKDKLFDEGRDTPTFYAREKDVRIAISQLSRQGLTPSVQSALSAMEDPDYRFRLYDEGEMPARQLIQFEYPSFVENVYALIPDSHKNMVGRGMGLSRAYKSIGRFFACSSNR